MKWLLIWACVVALLLFVAVALFVPPAAPPMRVLWSSSSGKPIPPGFRYAMIPSGSCEGLEDRIFLNTHNEMHSGSPISVFNADGEESILSATCFAFVETQPSSDQIDRTNTAISAWGDDTDMHSAFVDVEPESEGVIVRIRIFFKQGGTHEYRSRIVNGTAVPLEWKARKPR